MSSRRHFHSHERPPWWPENEPWPPERPWRMRRSPFFRRMGCFFLVFGFLGFVGFVSILTLVAEAFGFIPPTAGPHVRIFPVSFAFLFLTVLAIGFVFRSLRRLSRPLDDLLEASHRIADGDYTVRVEEAGTPEIRSLERSFNAMASQLEINETQRRAMLADLTHELRTPLTVMRGNLEGILDGLYPADESRLRTVLEETDMLSRLIDDLRTLALAESGALTLRREPTNLAALIRESLAAIEPQANAAAVSLRAELEDLPALQIDPQRTREVLLNLVGNALRYSPRGAIVTVRLAAGAADIVMISVEDSGPGIAAADLPHVFDRFYRSSDSGGMGLGLSIAKYIVEAHGGEIAVDSTPGRGTKISFWLPR